MQNTHAFFSDWGHVGRTALIGVIAYAALIAMLRIGGKRALIKLNVFDFAGTVAIGSALAATILSPDVTLVDGLVGVGVIVAAQALLAIAVKKASPLERFVNGDPLLLIHRGRLITDAMKQHHVTDEEIRAALRSNGVGALEDVAALVLETDGTFSVVRMEPGKTLWTLTDVPGIEDEEHGTDARPGEDDDDTGGGGAGATAAASSGAREGASAKQGADKQHGEG